MKRSLLLVSVIAVSCFVINSEWPSVSAQKDAASDTRSDDRALAASIRRFADRSTADLAVERMPDGSERLDLKGRFENVMLAKLDDDGDLAVGCVATLDEANRFFGRNLETGEKYLFTPDVPKYFADEAERHGMSVREYQFYRDIIDKWVAEQQESPQTATISIVNNDGAGEGFNDTTDAVAPGEGGNPGLKKGEQRLALFNAAANVWDGFLDSAVTIQVRSQFDAQTCSSGGAVLGSAGALGFYRNFTGAGVSNTWYHVALANKQRGSDLDAGNPDINATFNVDIDSGCFLPSVSRWYYGLDNANPAGTLNLFVVLLHEMGHGLGFSTLINGSSGQEAPPVGGDDIYGTFAFDEDVSQYWNLMATDTDRFNSARNENDVLWDGANVKLASGYLTAGRNAANGRVELYTPTAFSGGSSMSHFNTACTPSLLMEPFITAGLPLDLDLTKQQMRDIGWYRDTTANNVADTITNVALSATAVIGTNRTITWSNNGSFSRNVTIELSTDGGATFPTTIATNVANTGSYNWTVPSMPTTSTARLRVREHGFVAPSGASASNFSILITTAAAVSVSGVVRDASGRGLSRVRVTLTDGSGETRTVLTSGFGYFRFDDVPAGAAYVISARDKRYQFAPQIVNIADEITGLELIASP